MKKYIKSATQENQPYQFQWIQDEYLGGNAIAVYGQLTDGTFFYTNDMIDGVWFLDADPSEMLTYWEDDYWYNWLKEHELSGADGQEYYRFWIDLFNYCKENGIQLSTYDDYDATIEEFKAAIK